jgi:4'-phosphopantetheinyl transferase
MNEGWKEPEHWPTLPAGEVHVWLAHIPPLRVRLDEFIQLLSPEERERAARFRFDEHRERSQITRGLLRSLLGRYSDRSPGELCFVYNAHGKPEVKNCGIHFNTSHSGDYAAFAFTRSGAVGVDIEQFRDDITRREQIAEKYFAAGERTQLQALSEGERSRAFFDLWTRKEAFVKARGDGLFSGLNQFEVCLREPRVVSVRNAAATNWWMDSLPEINDYAGAVVVNAPSCAPRFWKCTEPFAINRERGGAA